MKNCSCAFLLLLLSSCDIPNPPIKAAKEPPLFFQADNRTIDPPKPLPLPVYPWEKEENYLTPITEKRLSCRGYKFHTPQKVLEGNTQTFVYDCKGSELPEDGQSLRKLAEELTLLQTTCRKKVIVTSGYRCKEHIRYCESVKATLPSSIKKGKAATFFFEGEEPPLLSLLQNLGYTPLSSTLWKKGHYSLQKLASYSQNDPDNTHPYPYFLLSIE